jgi:capsular polysaccharide biosynthesis protein
MAIETGDRTLAELVRSAWGYRTVAVAGFVVGAVVAGAAATALAPRYLAATQVLAYGDSSDTGNPAQGRRFNGVNVDTLAEQATSTSALNTAAAESGVDEGSLDTTVTVLPNTSVLALYVAADTPEAAKTASLSLANSLIENRAADLRMNPAAVGQVLRVGEARKQSPVMWLWLINGAALGMLLACVARGVARRSSRLSGSS